jgi:LysM repeat protein
MYKRSTWLISLSMLMASCSSHMAVVQQDKHENTLAFNEMRSEIADLRHALNSTQVELQILDEQVKAQETSLKKSKNVPSPSWNDSKQPQIEKRLTQIEQTQERILSDLKQLSSHANQTSSSFHQYSAKLSELEQSVAHQQKLMNDIVDLKSTLKTFSASLQSPIAQNDSYTVKPGDSLEKIARNHKISVESLKKANQLSSPKILIGQELHIPKNE